MFAKAGREKAYEQPAQISACLEPGTELKAKVKKNPRGPGPGVTQIRTSGDWACEWMTATEGEEPRLCPDCQTLSMGSMWD